MRGLTSLKKLARLDIQSMAVTRNTSLLAPLVKLDVLCLQNTAMAGCGAYCAKGGPFHTRCYPHTQGQKTAHACVAETGPWVLWHGAARHKTTDAGATVREGGSVRGRLAYFSELPRNNYLDSHCQLHFQLL